MPPGPPIRRRRHRGADHRFLPALAGVVDATTAGAAGHVAVRVVGPVHDEVELGLLPLPAGSHPFGELAGTTAPDDWTVFGLRATGRAHHLDRPSGPSSPVVSTFLVDRHGREASLLRIEDEVTEPPGRAAGTIPDLCRRVLGLPTAPAPPTTEVLWSTIWAHRILDRLTPPAGRRGPLPTFGQLAVLHPAVDRAGLPDLLVVADPASLARVARPHAAAHPWTVLRNGSDPLPLPDGPLRPGVARWMDDGFFARWTIGAHPPLGPTALHLRHLLGDALGPRLLEALVLLLEP